MSAIKPNAPATTFVLKYPQSGSYTIAVAPRTGGSSAFTLKASMPPPPTTQPPVVTCLDDVCSSSYPLIISTDASVGEEFGASAVFPFEVSCPGPISAYASWFGSAENLALILNGPGQVGYFGRRDGESPLTVEYTATPADVRNGSRWWVSLANFNGGTAAARVNIEYPDPDSCAVGDSISNLRINSITDDEVELTVDYTYSGDYGDNVFMGAHALQDGETLQWFGYRPAQLTPGSGTATVSLVLLADAESVPSNFTTDQVELDMYVGGGEAFLTQAFDFGNQWVTAPAYSFRDKILNSVDSSGVGNSYQQEAVTLVDTLIGSLGEFSYEADVGDRINGMVSNVWGGWIDQANTNGFDAYVNEPADYGFSPFRQLIIRMIQGRQYELDSRQEAALLSFLTRNEDASVWWDNVNGVVGALNREYLH